MVQELGLDICPSTVRYRFRESGLQGALAAQKPLLREDNIKKRLEWAKKHLDWTELDWKKRLVDR